VILEVSPSLQTDPSTLNKIYVKSPITNQQVPLSTFARFDTHHVSYLSINHQGQFPAVTLSFNLAPGAALGDAVDAINKVTADIRMPASMNGTFQGTAQAFESSLKSEPYLILAALGGRVHHPGNALRELHPPADHSLHAALGRGGRRC